MGTQVQAVSAARTDDMAQYGGLKNTTVRVSDDTKRLLDRLREQQGAGSFDELLFGVLSAMVQHELPLGAVARSAGRRASGDAANAQVSELAEQVELLSGQVEELLDVVSRLATLLDGQVQDPTTGHLFHWRGVKHAPAGKLPKPRPQGHARAGLVEKAEGLFSENEPESEALAHVQAPSGVYLTERDGTLPAEVAEAIRDEQREKKPARKATR